MTIDGTPFLSINNILMDIKKVRYRRKTIKIYGADIDMDKNTGHCFVAISLFGQMIKYAERKPAGEMGHSVLLGLIFMISYPLGTC